MSDDIVTRLRLYATRMKETKSSVLGLLLSDAADEIERLRAEALMQYWQYCAEVARLQTERDEARQRYCIAVSEHGESAEAQQIAKDEGWDCFKENTDER